MTSLLPLVSKQTLRKIEMAGSLSFFEIEQFVQALKNSRIGQIGTKDWFEEHRSLETLRKEYILEINNFLEENVKEAFYEYQKISYLIHESILIQVWREKVWKKISKKIKDDRELNNQFIVYMVFYHEITSLNLLQMLLFHREMVKQLGDHCLDLIDYCVTQIVGISQVGPAEATKAVKDDSKLDENEMALSRGLSSVAILTSLAEYLDDLSVSDVIRLYQTHDVPLLFAYLIEIQPWRRGNLAYVEGRWIKDTSGEVNKSEAQCWLGIRGLLLHEAAQRHYEITALRQRQLLPLQARLNETLLDQISPLLELRRWLAQASIANQPRLDPSPLLIETVPVIKEALLNKKSEWKGSMGYFESILFGESCQDDSRAIAKVISETYDDFLLQDSQGVEKCAACGEAATKRCSACKSVWYCSRKCQVDSWADHKGNCNHSKQ